MQDPDSALFPYLISGVLLGIEEDITPLHCFPLNQTETPFEPPLLSVQHTHWQSAEDEPSIVQELVDTEVEAGWVTPFLGTVEDAQAYFQHGLAIGKRRLALSDTGPPRLSLGPHGRWGQPTEQSPREGFTSHSP